MPTIWTQSFRLAWRPELRYFEERTRVLRRFEDAGLLSAFRMEDARTRARLRGVAATIEFDHVGLEVHLDGAEEDRARPLEAVALILEMLKPSNLRRVTCQMKLTDELDGTYRDARRTGVESFFPSSPRHVVTDFSFLLDGVSVEPAATFQIEYGIVEASEIPERVAGVVGRLSAPARYREAEDEAESYPDVAIFLGVSWTLAEPPPKSGVPEYLEEVLQGLEDSSRSLMGTVRTQLFPPTTTELS